MSELAILGGKPVLEKTLPVYHSMGQAELDAVKRVVESDCLSAFYGSWGDRYMGGPVVRAFEQAWALHFQVKHAVSVNSATSGLFASMGAIGIGPGDEVIVPPLTMSATAMAPLVYGGIPVFADVDPVTFCLDISAVEQAISIRTRAIIAVNLFGQPAPLARLRQLAEQKGLWLVEDNAQGPLAMEAGRYAGTIGHIGVFSLNYHKHIHTGEGGFCVTNEDSLALRMQMIRNHAENAVEHVNLSDLTNLYGFNYRMTELSAAVGLAQLEAIDSHVDRRTSLAEALSAGIDGLDGLTVPHVRENCRHVYYVWALRYDESRMGVSRAVFSRALTAEGFPHATGYVRPLYLLPIFQRRIGMGSNGFPFTLSKVQYTKGLCPVAEQLHEKELLLFEPCAYAVTVETTARLVEAVRKVYEHRHELVCLAPSDRKS